MNQEQLDKIYNRLKTKHTYKKQGDTEIEARCTVHEDFVTFVGKSKLYHCTIWLGKYTGAKCDCDGYKFNKKCKHLLALAMWAKGER